MVEIWVDESVNNWSVLETIVLYGRLPGPIEDNLSLFADSGVFRGIVCQPDQGNNERCKQRKA